MRERLIALLSKKPAPPADLPAIVPDEIGRGVLRWGMPSGAWHMLYHVRQDAILAWHVRTSNPGTPRAPLTAAQIEAFTAWMESISDEEMHATSAARPLVFVPREVWRPFDGFAIVHASLAKYSAREDDYLCPPRAHLVFPSYACEIPVSDDLAWMKVQKEQIAWSDLSRAPACAVRSGTPANGKTPKARQPMRPRDVLPSMRAFRIRDGRVDLENCRGQVLHLEDGAATSDDARIAIAGRGHLAAVVTAFVQRGELPIAPGSRDPFARGKTWDQIEATCGDVVEGVEPVLFEERATGAVVARLWVKHDARVLDVAYADVDDRLTPEILDEAILDAYLRVFTNHFYRGKVDIVRVHPRGTRGDARELAYPAK
jgi:hypothetical protein